jgi:hypothetical protein
VKLAASYQSLSVAASGVLKLENMRWFCKDWPTGAILGSTPAFDFTVFFGFVFTFTSVSANVLIFAALDIDE